MNPTEVFRQARDCLLAHRTDYAAACREFRWPRPERFNWAIDWFDVIARGNTRTALRIVGDGDVDSRVTFDGLRRRSNLLAAHMRSLGVTPGDRVLLMLGNVPACHLRVSWQRQAEASRDFAVCGRNVSEYWEEDV